MITALDAPTGSLDAQERSFVSNIRKHGWFRTNVTSEKEQPGFAFTTGLWSTLGQPEVIVFSLRSETSHAILWDVFRDLKSGRALPVGKPIPDLVEGGEPVLLPVATRHYCEHLGWSRWFYGGDHFPCLQLVWPDRMGRLPWEPHFDPKLAGLQPDLSDNDWGSGVRQQRVA